MDKISTCPVFSFLPLYTSEQSKNYLCCHFGVELRDMEIFPNIDKIDDSPDWDNIQTIMRNTSKYELGLIDEILEKISSLSEVLQQTRIKETLDIGPIFDEEPNYSSQTAISHIRTKFLKRIEQMGLIEDLLISRETSSDDLAYIKADFKYTPYQFIDRLEAWKLSAAQDRIKSTPKKQSNEIELKTKGEKGYLLWENHEIYIGRADTGKFRLLKIFQNTSIGTAKSVDSVFEAIQTTRNRNEPTFKESYGGSEKKLELIKNQVKEIQRAIAIYGKENKVHRSRLPRISLRTDRNKVWFEIDARR